VVEALKEEDPLHVDETSWPLGSAFLWLWVIVTASLVYFWVGRRTRAVFAAHY
jgi:hypothetical protein